MALVKKFAEAERDAKRYKWVRPILARYDTKLANKRAMIIAAALFNGINIDDAIDTALESSSGAEEGERR